MSSPSLLEKIQLEKLLKMASGYVLDFTDATFGDFFIETVGIDIHSEKYQKKGSSKAKKLREFWKAESDAIVGKVILALVVYAESTQANSLDPNLASQCKEMGNRLLAGKISLNDLKNTVFTFDAKYLADQIRRMEQSVETDPSLAIGTAKELIETCCKTILAERGKPTSGNPDIPYLTKETLRELNLVPEGIPESTKGRDAIKRLLQNLGTISNYLSELRNLYGTGHGKHGKTEALKPRHAKLAVGAASTLVNFLFETHKEKMP